MTDHDRAPAVLYDVKDRKAFLTLNPPDRLIAIGSRLPGELAGAVRKADIDPDVHVDAQVEELADRVAGVPVNQLAMQKLMINQAYDYMGLHGTQILTMLFDGITWYSPEGCWFQEFAATYGSHEAVKWRDTSRWSPTADDLEEG